MTTKVDCFNQEWQTGIIRFKHLIGLKSLNINLKNPRTKLPAKPHEALPEVFVQWQQIESLWDRQSLIFETIYELVAQHLRPWQTANFLNINRQPVEALELLQETISSDLKSEDYTQSCASLAQTLINLIYYEDASSWAYKAYKNDKSNPRFQTIMADCLFLNNKDEEAVTIYQLLMDKSNISENDSVAKIFSDLFSRLTGIVPSPVWAVEFAKSIKDTEKASEFWQLGEQEYYDSPYFRSQYAYYLAEIGELQRSFAKLIALVQEMPWLKEASLNLLRYFQHFDPAGNKVMPNFQVQLRQQIKNNNWTTEGMDEIEVGK